MGIINGGRYYEGTERLDELATEKQLSIVDFINKYGIPYDGEIPLRLATARRMSKSECYEFINDNYSTAWLRERLFKVKYLFPTADILRLKEITKGKRANELLDCMIDLLGINDTKYKNEINDEDLEYLDSISIAPKELEVLTDFLEFEGLYKDYMDYNHE